MLKLDLPKIEKKWQKRWEKARLYEVKDSAAGKKNFYHLVMFPYPSGDLHIGHWYNFAPADIYARFKRMQGFNVLSPIGFDAFGLPAENAAIKRKLHPATWTFQNIERMREQFKSMGTIYDWSREVITCAPEYYQWTQWMFLQMFKAGLARRQKTWANWCPSCKTVLANEQVIEGRCERCDSEVIQKQIDQWVFLITRYAQRLLNDLNEVDWPEKTKTMQKNWIGQSEGATIKFNVKSETLIVEEIEVFTTRADTIFGATYLVLAPEHEILKHLLARIENAKEIKNYTDKALKKTPLQRQAEQKIKTGIELKGIKAVNPATGNTIPIWVADYVLGGYGTGAVMGVPAHDERDFEFAKTFGLPIVKVIAPNILQSFLRNPMDVASGAPIDIRLIDESYEGEGDLINSSKFNGMSSVKAREEIITWLVKKKMGKKSMQYKLRDWIVSRQRYWGAPIPIVECQTCGQVAVPEKDLPVLLPDIKDFKPTGTGESPLATSKEFVNVKCPQCGSDATRETDTMDTFVDSSWYFLRFADAKNTKEFAAKAKMKKWLPVNMYIGGAEHSVLHLLYARFFTKVLYDLGYVWFNEPFLKLRHQGIILGPDGQKMSKSRGNVIDPDELVKAYGADAVRTYLAFMGPYDQGGPWSPGAINGIARFLERVQRLVTRGTKSQNHKADVKHIGAQRLLHKTIKKVSEDLEALKFNTAISALMVLVNEMQGERCEKKDCEVLVKLLAPFAPHLSEELWAKIGHKTSVHVEAFPAFDEELAKEDMATIVIQINGKMRGKIDVETGALEGTIRDLASGEEHAQAFLKGKEIKKTIFVPNRLINFVIEE